MLPVSDVPAVVLPPRSLDATDVRWRCYHLEATMLPASGGGMMRHGVDGFSLSSWEPQEEGMISTAASFSLNKKPRYVETRKKPNSRR
jgi:hypothetical protein